MGLEQQVLRFEWFLGGSDNCAEVGRMGKNQPGGNTGCKEEQFRQKEQEQLPVLPSLDCQQHLRSPITPSFMSRS